MNLTKCRWCGKLYQRYTSDFCISCLQELDQSYKPVRDYLYDNPNATIDEIEEVTGVTRRVILYYLRDGRLQMTNTSGLLRCEQCGESINSGRLCDKCTKKIEQRIVRPMQARMAQAETEQDGNGRMHFSRDRLNRS